MRTLETGSLLSGGGHIRRRVLLVAEKYQLALLLNEGGWCLSVVKRIGVIFLMHLYFFKTKQLANTLV